MREIVSRFAVDESGATMVEYVLLLGLIVLGALGAITQLGKGLGHSFNNAADKV